jgi:hypothetical protein
MIGIIREMVWYLVNDGLTGYSDTEVSVMISTAEAGVEPRHEPGTRPYFRSVLQYIFNACPELSMKNALYPIEQKDEAAAMDHIISYVMRHNTVSN